MNHYQLFKQVVDQLTESIRKGRLRIDPANFDDTARAAYFREFRTVEVNMGRQTGKTTWALKHNGKDVMILTRNQQTRDSLRSRWYELDCNRGMFQPVIVTRKDLTKLLEEKQPQKFSKIIVDEATYVFDAVPRNRFYKEALPLCNDDTLFVMLG